MRDVVVRENPNRLLGEISPDDRIAELEQQEAARAREKKSAYREWAQLNLDSTIMDALDKLAEKPAAMRVFFFMVKHMDGYNALVASHTVMCQALGMSVATVARAVKYLADKNIIQIQKSGVSNVYTLNKDIVWKSWGSNMQYCEFAANVVLARSEQEDKTSSVSVRDKKVQTVTATERGRR